jgi:hypothetical protein
MDPFSLIGLIASIVTFVDFAHKVLAECKRLNESASGATIGNGHIESLTTNLQALSLDLQLGKPESAMKANEFRLNSLAKDCQAISADLLLLLDGLKAKNPKSIIQVVHAAWRAVRKKNEIGNLAERLKKCQQLLHLQLSQVTRSVSWAGGYCDQESLCLLVLGSKYSIDSMLYSTLKSAKKRKYVPSVDILNFSARGSNHGISMKVCSATCSHFSRNLKKLCAEGCRPPS